MRSALARRVEGYETELEIRGHRLTADEPEDEGGRDAGPRPTEMLAAALASCTVITIVMYADRKGWDVGAIEVVADYIEPTADAPAKFETKISIPAPLDDDQQRRVRVIASKCPVHRTLRADDIEIEDSLELMEA
jgi:putative redox protein